MQIWRRKAWEIWSHVVTSGRPRVDIQGAVPDKALSCTISPSAGGQSISKAVSMLFVVHNTGDVLT